MTTARPTNGTTLKVLIAAVDVEVGLLDSIKPPHGKVNIAELDPLNLLTTVNVATGGLKNEPSEFAVYLDLLDTTHSFCLQITNDPAHAQFGVEQTWTVTLPIAGVAPWIYTGILESFPVAIEKGTLQKATGMIKVNESTQLPLETA